MSTETAMKRLDAALARTEHTLSELKEQDYPLDPDTTLCRRDSQMYGIREIVKWVQQKEQRNY